VFILGILSFFIGGALALFAWRAPLLKAGGIFAPISREGALVVNNLLLCTACLSVLIGTLYPLALETLTGEKISVGPPYFNLTFGSIILPLLLLVPLGPFLTWKRADLFGAMQRLWFAALITGGAALLILVAVWRGPWLAPIGMALGIWLIAGSLSELAARAGLLTSAPSVSLARLRGLPGAAIGMSLAHAGLGIAIIGIIAVSLWKVEVIAALKPGETVSVGNYAVTFQGERPLAGANYTGEAGRFRIALYDREVTVLVSEKRIFQPSGTPTTEVGLHQTLAGDLYVVMGERTGDGRAVRLYFNPLVNLIWLGAAVMFLGGVMSLTDRRYRIGAPKRFARVQAPAE
jgi:cytochrome c-type biogenesis protein CcmF